MSSTILVTGGTGFVGQALCQALVQQGHVLTVLSRQPRRGSDAIRYVQSLEAIPNPLPPIIINLAGEGIAESRWTDSRRKRLHESRVALTQSIHAFYQSRKQHPEVLISASAIGVYGDHSDAQITERSETDGGYAHELCRDWEAAANAFAPMGTRVCCLRIGVVFGKGGMLKKLETPFSLGLGGRLGSGEQYMSWIDLEDLLQIILLSIDDPRLTGAINACSPYALTNGEFTALLAAQLNRPAFFHMPALIVSLLFGEMGRELLLCSQRVHPQRLIELGFAFGEPDAKASLKKHLQ